MEYTPNGTLEGLMKHVKPLPIETIRFWAAELVLALEDLHKCDISHRDLKPGNILLDSDYHIKLCDFGEAKLIEGIDRDMLQKEYDDAMTKLQEEQKRQCELD